ncbi:hypothetical protein L345_09217, partial [Ophiophagus hannah]
MIDWAAQTSPLFASFLAKLTTKTQNRHHLVPSRANAILAQTWQRKSTKCEHKSCATNLKDRQGHVSEASAEISSWKKKDLFSPSQSDLLAIHKNNLELKNQPTGLRKPFWEGAIDKATQSRPLLASSFPTFNDFSSKPISPTVTQAISKASFLQPTLLLIPELSHFLGSPNPKEEEEEEGGRERRRRKKKRGGRGGGGGGGKRGREGGGRKEEKGKKEKNEN